MRVPTITRLTKSIFTGMALALALTQTSKALDNGVDPWNLQKGDWVYVLSTATNKLGGNVTSVTNVASLMNYEKSQGMAFIVIKHGEGSTNFPSAGSPQFTASVVTAAHNAGLKIFGYTRSYGVNITGEIQVATNALNLGADGYIIDAEVEWEGLANAPTKATNLLQGIKNVFPNRFLAHSPFMYVSLHSSFPYKQFGLFCDAVMPQDYWHEMGISSTACVADMDTEWNNFHASLTGSWTNAIKPVAPIGQAWNGVTSTEINNFYNAVKTSANPATPGGYNSISWWRADLHTASMWTAIGGNTIGDNTSVAPVISNVTATNISNNSATITWTTDQNSDSVVNYGLTSSYGSTTSSSTMTVSHSVNIAGLSAATTYHFRVKSKNINNLTATSGDFTFVTTSGVSDITIDNTGATVVGTWSTGTSATDKFGSDYRYKGGGTGASYLQYTPNITTAGDYNVYAWYSAGANRTVAAPYTITYNGGTTATTLNQQANGGAWNLVGTFNFALGTAGNVKVNDNYADSANVVIADAIKFSFAAAPTPPVAPSGLTATTISSSRIDLSWTDNSSDETGFTVSRSTTPGGPYSDIATTAANATSYSNTGLSSSTTYYYVVRAVNAAGSSALSAQASATTSGTPPAAPSGLSAATVSSSRIDLSWTDNSGNETGFVVARSTTSGGPYTDIVTTAASATSYSNTGLSASTTYYYVVRAINGAGSSANSAQASATTAATPPAAPSGLTATAISSGQVNLAWTDNSANETSFIVARSTTSGGPYTDIATLGANVTAYSDTAVGANTTYFYVVRSANAGGSSANSAQASVTTPSGAPVAPSGLVATPSSSTAIRLSWTDNSNNEANFIVGRSTTSGGPYTDIATLGANVTTYTNTGLTAGTTYYYVVRSSNGNGSSVNSAQASASPVADIIIDNPSATVTGTWSTGTSSTDKFGTDYRFVSAAGTGVNNLKYTPTIAVAGNYNVYEWHPQGSNRTTDAPIVVKDHGGTVTNRVNQTINGGTWVLLGTYNFAAGTTGNVKVQDNYTTGTVVMADAIKFVLNN